MSLKCKYCKSVVRYDECKCDFTDVSSYILHNYASMYYLEIQSNFMNILLSKLQEKNLSINH